MYALRLRARSGRPFSQRSLQRIVSMPDRGWTAVCGGRWPGVWNHLLGAATFWHGAEAHSSTSSSQLKPTQPGAHKCVKHAVTRCMLHVQRVRASEWKAHRGRRCSRKRRPASAPRCVGCEHSTSWPLNIVRKSMGTLRSTRAPAMDRLRRLYGNLTRRSHLDSSQTAPFLQGLEAHSLKSISQSKPEVGGSEIWRALAESTPKDTRSSAQTV
jgi:hypothetical protein